MHVIFDLIVIGIVRSVKGVIVIKHFHYTLTFDNLILILVDASLFGSWRRKA